MTNKNPPWHDTSSGNVRRSLVVPNERTQIVPSLRIVIQIACSVISGLGLILYMVLLTHTVSHTRLYSLASMSKHVHDPGPTECSHDCEWHRCRRDRPGVGDGRCERREGVCERLERMDGRFWGRGVESG